MDAKSHQNAAAHRWDRLAAHMLRAERTQSWRKTHASFSSWVADMAKSLDRGEATLWRALAAGRYYNDLKQASRKRGITLPGLGNHRLAASPEALELAAKIARVAPAEVAEQLTKKTVEGTISRRELRAYWETYRPVLKGRTARGRNVPAPQFNPRSIDMVSSRLEADCVAGLIQAGSAWLGVAKSHLYKVISLSTPLPPGLGIRCVPDVVVLYQRDAKHSLEVHGVEATARPARNAVIKHYQAHGLGVDAFWVVTPSETQPHKQSRCPEIGLLEADPKGVRVIRSAGVPKQNRDETVKLLRILLAREVAA